MKNLIKPRTEKFADRVNDLKECKDFYTSKESVLCIKSERHSGLSFFMLKLYEDEIFKKKKSRIIDIYLADLTDRKELSALLIEDIINQKQGIRFSLAQKNLPLYIIKNIISIGLPFLYLVSTTSNIGFSIADSASTLINSEIPSVDLLHRKIVKYFSKKKMPSVILLDSAENLTTYDLNLIKELLDINVKFVFAFKTTDDRVNKEKFIKLFPNKQIDILHYDFHHPDKIMLQELCNIYKKNYSAIEKLLLDSSNDIIKIMSIINDTVLDLSIEEKEILSFVYYSDGTINKEILRICYDANFQNLIYKDSFETVFEGLIRKNLIINQNGLLTTDYIFEDAFANSILYRLNICNIYFSDLLSRNLDQLQYIIKYEQQIYNKIKTILVFAQIKFKMGQNISAEMAFILSNSLERSEESIYKEKIETVLSIYYIKEFNYSNALSILKKSKKQSRLLKKLYAYVLNRSQNLNESEKAIIDLIGNNTDTDELAILVSILSINLLHQNRANEAIDIYYNRSTICNYNQFSNSNKKVYFLRNIAYYLDEKDSSKCYEIIKELSKNKNYTYFLFTTANNQLARRLTYNDIIEQNEVEKIIKISKNVPYYEQRLFFNNLGIYYLEKDKNLSFSYFEKSIYLAKTYSALPYVFSKINYALALAYYGDFVNSSNIFDELESVVKESKLIRIKSSYYSAKLLFDYMIDNDISDCVKQLSRYPLRKGTTFTQNYIEQIKMLIKNNTKYKKELFNSLYLKNVTFYWYIDPMDLFNSEEILSF